MPMIRSMALVSASVWTSSPTCGMGRATSSRPPWCCVCRAASWRCRDGLAAGPGRRVTLAERLDGSLWAELDGRNPSRRRPRPRPSCVPEQEHGLPRLRMSLPSPSMTGPSPMTPRQGGARTVAPRSHGDQRPTVPGVAATSLADIFAGQARDKVAGRTSDEVAGCRRTFPGARQIAPLAGTLTHRSYSPRVGQASRARVDRGLEHAIDRPEERLGGPDATESSSCVHSD